MFDVLGLGVAASISLDLYFFFRLRLYAECTFSASFKIFNAPKNASLITMI